MGYNTAIGNFSLTYNTTGEGNTAVGNSSSYTNTTGSFNTAIGYKSLFYETIGSHNTAIGHNSLYSSNEGYYNTAVGRNSLYSNTIGYHNTALGYSSLINNTTGDCNTAIGEESLLNNTTGGYNTAIGYRSGEDLTSGSGNTFIGLDANNGSTLNKSIVLGGSQIQFLFCQVDLTVLSDARDKKNISDLSLGLDFITKLKPRQFNWDKRDWYEDKKSDGSKMEDNLSVGFIAQELDEVQQSENAEWLDLVYKSNPEKLEVTKANLMPVMVKAIQELNEKNETLEEEITQLKSEIESLKDVNEKLVNLEKLIMEMKANENEIKEIKSSSN